MRQNRLVYHPLYLHHQQRQRPLYRQLTILEPQSQGEWTIIMLKVKCINIKIVYPTANRKHTKLMTRTLQLALPKGAESFPNIKSHTLGTGCGVPQPLLGATKAGDTKLWEMVAIRDFRLCTNQNIIIRSSHSQFVQISMETTNIGIEDPNLPVRTWTRIWLDIATNNKQQTQPIGKMKENNFVKKNRRQKCCPPSRAILPGKAK